MVRLTRCQSAMSFGSKTTHCVPSSTEPSMKLKRRRTLMYRHAGSLESVRAPQTRIPRPGNARMTLIPWGFSWSCSPLVTWSSSEIAPRTTSFAGAL